jgi:hypothetical protein
VARVRLGGENHQRSQHFAELTGALSQIGLSGQANLRDRPHGEGQGSEFYGKRGPLASWGAQRGGIATGLAELHEARRKTNWRHGAMSASRIPDVLIRRQSDGRDNSASSWGAPTWMNLPIHCWNWPRRILQCRRRHQRFARLGQARASLASSCRNKWWKWASPSKTLVGITAGLAACGKKSFGVSPACFPHRAFAGANQKRHLLFGRAGHAHWHQRRGELRRARQHAPFAARPGRAARHQ